MLLLLAVASLSASAAQPMEAGVRARYLVLPDAWLNPWLVEQSTAGFDRPDVRAWAVGGEFTLDSPAVRWTFYLERFTLLVDEGYWDDEDDPPDSSDGHWVRPDGPLGMVDLGANVGKLWAFTDKSSDVWLGAVVDGGLGLGVLTGQLTRWTAGSGLSADPVADSDCGPFETADLRYSHCGDDGEEPIPPVLPMLDLDLGLHVDIKDTAYVRFEGGLHTFVYGGIAAGGQF